MAVPDLINNPLGISSYTGSAVKEKPAAANQMGFPTIERPADPRPGIERQRAEIGVKTEDLDAKIIQNLADQGQFQAQQAKQKVESEAQSLRDLDASRKALEKTLYESPTYKNIQEKSKELAEKSTFNPDQQNAQTLAAVFSIIGAAGFLLGGNNKNTAKAALAAMNGMAEGYSKGRDQYAKEQRQVFETNQKALRGTLDSLEKAFTLELEQNKNDLESATRNAKIAALERDASFINDNIDKYGLVSTLEQLRSNKKRLETVLDALQKKEDAYKSTLEKEWFSSEEKKAVAAAAQERVRYQEQERTAREQERRRDQERRDIERREDTQRFQLERDRFRLENRPPSRVGIQDGQMVRLPDPRTLPLANVAAPISSVTAGTKKEATVKPPPKEILTRVEARDSLIPSLKELLPTLDRLNKQGKYNELSLALNSPTGAEWYFKDDLDAIKAIRILAKFRGGEFETAGKSLTKREDEILRPLYQAANRPYVAVRNAVEEGLKELTQQNEGYKNAYPEFYKRQSAPTDRLAQTMDQAGATPGGSGADERGQAQAAILKIQNSQLTQEQKKERVKSIESSYKQRTGLDL